MLRRPISSEKSFYRSSLSHPPLLPLSSVRCGRRATLPGHRPSRSQLGVRRRPASATWRAQRLVSLGLESGFVWTKAFPGPGRPCPLSMETSGQLYWVWLGTISRGGGRVLCIGSLSPARCPRGGRGVRFGDRGRGDPWYTSILAAKSRRKVSAPDSYFSAESGRCQAPLLFIVRTEVVPASELTRNGTYKTDL